MLVKLIAVFSVAMTGLLFVGLDPTTKWVLAGVVLLVLVAASVSMRAEASTIPVIGALFG